MTLIRDPNSAVRPVCQPKPRLAALHLIFVTLAARSAQEPGGTFTLGRPKILVVEDNLFLAMELEDALLSAGFDVVGKATSASQAIEFAREHTPDLVVMDIRLEGNRDGIDAAIDMLNIFGIRTIFASAHSEPDLRDRGAAAKPVGWVTKPYNMADLIGLIRAALSPPTPRTT